MRAFEMIKSLRQVVVEHTPFREVDFLVNMFLNPLIKVFARHDGYSMHYSDIRSFIKLSSSFFNIIESLFKRLEYGTLVVSR